MIMKFYLCRLVNHILWAMETSNVTHLISVDLQKTFNCLAHETLLEKIHLLAVFFLNYTGATIAIFLITLKNSEQLI